jgi:hypothetical protein
VTFLSLANGELITPEKDVVTLRVWSPAADKKVLLKLEDASNAGVYAEVQATTTEAGGWQTLTYDFGSVAGLDHTKTYNKASVFPDFLAEAAGQIYWFDDAKFLDAVVAPPPPSAPAPAPGDLAQKPTRLAAEVISLFSDDYTDVIVNDWSTGWDSAGVSDETIEGESVKRYDDLLWAAIQFTSEPIDATDMTHLHLDVWKRDPDTPLKIKVVDFGADGVYNEVDGDDVEHELSFNTSGTQDIPGNQWASLDIPLSSFTGLTTRAHLAQMILSGGGTGDTLWVDNVYFYNANPVG